MNPGSPSHRRSHKRVNFAGSFVNCPCHICALFKSSDEQHAALLPFVKEGFERGERCLQFVNKSEREERLNLLTAFGIDVDAMQRSGALEIEVWENAYLRDGKFDVTSMLEFVQECLGTGVRRGFPRTRLWANMEWALSGAPGVDDIAEYESRLNYILPLTVDAVVCAYDVTRFSAPLLENIIKAHPYLSADGWGRANPDYVAPDHLLPELRAKL